jgi:hypothetical protein
LQSQWKLESAGKGIYKILNRENVKSIRVQYSGHDLMISNYDGKDNQLWKIEDSHNGLFKISNKQFPNMILSM